MDEITALVFVILSAKGAPLDTIIFINPYIFTSRTKGTLTIAKYNLASIKITVEWNTRHYYDIIVLEYT